MSAWIVGWLAFVMVAVQGSKAEAPRSSAAGARPPNIIFIQAEAQGPGSISVDFDGEPPSTARPEGLTPHLERLAKEGMRFSDFYASCPRCTPSRASFVTGISPAKLHMTYQSEGGASRGGGDQKSRYRLMRLIPPEAEFELPPGVRTSGAMLHDLGYGTAHFGKWHAARQAPSQLGFDACDGANSNQGPDRGESPNPRQATIITDKGIAFMREQVKKGKPFFVQISHYGFEGENAVSPESLAAARKLMPDVSGKPMGAVAGAREVDTQVGRVLDALKDMGVADNTWIFYSADHGAQGGGGGGRSQANPPFSGGKGSVSEGGIRVPFLVWGPGVKPGSVCRVRASGMDLLPTMMDLAGKPLPKPAHPDDVTAVEGGSLVPLLTHGGEGKVERSHEALVIHFPHYDLNNGGPASAIYLDGWKMVRNYDSGKTTLYEIGKDPAERKDLASEQPDRVKDMTSRLDAYLKAVKAAMPERNTDPAAGTGDPHDMPQPDGRGGGKGGGKGVGKGGKGAGHGA